TNDPHDLVRTPFRPCGKCHTLPNRITAHEQFLGQRLVDNSHVRTIQNVARRQGSAGEQRHLQRCEVICPRNLNINFHWCFGAAVDPRRFGPVAAAERAHRRNRYGFDAWNVLDLLNDLFVKPDDLRSFTPWNLRTQAEQYESSWIE